MPQDKNKPRIISMVGREIAQYHQRLHEGFDDLGVDNHFFYERTHPFYTHKKSRLKIEQWITYLNDIIVRDGRGLKEKMTFFLFLYPAVVVLKFILFPYFVRRYDVFIYSTNYSFLGLYLDRLILKLLGKTIIDVVLGSDARVPYMNGKFLETSPPSLFMRTFLKKISIRAKIKTTTYLIDHPTLSHFNNRNYIPHLYVGIPFSLADQPPVKENKRPLLLHAPSAPKIKGSDIIREAIEELKPEYDFDYEELIGVPHEIVLKKIQQCSFVINDMYSDTLMAGLDTESAWFAKPSIVGGYGLEAVEQSVKGYDVAPTYRIDPSKDALKKAIIHLLTDDAYRVKLGQDAQNFVKKNWNSKTVAQKYLNIAQGNIPDDLIRSPFDDSDIHGCGISEKDRRKLISDMISKCGYRSLCLDDKPKIKQMILDDCS